MPRYFRTYPYILSAYFGVFVLTRTTSVHTYDLLYILVHTEYIRFIFSTISVHICIVAVHTLHCIVYTFQVKYALVSFKFIPGHTGTY